ncbi:MAG: pitrilysin family protein [Pseudomonadota bacterium]
MNIPVFHTLRASAFGLLLALGAATAFAALPIQHWTQPSGARVYLVESHALPMVDVQIDFDAGGRRNPAGKAGLASFTAGHIDKGLRPAQGGRASAYPQAMDENQIGQAWADLGAGLSEGAGSDKMSFSLRSLSEPDILARAVDLASRHIGEPAFPADIWQRDRERVAAAIREANTRPAAIAEKAWLPAVYGGHPYGWEVTEQTLAAISVEDMRAFYATHIQACRARVSIVGALTRAQADAVAASLLARLPAPPSGRCESLPAVAEIEPLRAPVLREIAFPSAQSHVLIGQPGYKRSDPDFFPMLVGNYILGGGGFVSRLSQEVRERRGLSYSVYSYFAPGMHAGAFTLGLQTRPDQARQAVRVASEVVSRFVAEGPTEAEMQAAKDNLIGGFALRIDSNRKLLDQVAAIAWHELPLDYLDTWTQRVRAVTLDQVREAFRRKLQPDRMVTVTVGPVAAPTTQQSTRSLSGLTVPALAPGS